jgi:hypothetical protein
MRDARKWRLCKHDRIDYCDSAYPHASLFSGVNLDLGGQTRYAKKRPRLRRVVPPEAVLRSLPLRARVRVRDASAGDLE